MNTDKNKTYIFLVLIPHTDARAQLQKQSEELIKNGLSNLYPFPHAAPLASLSKPLSSVELKNTARALRENIGNKKIFISETSSVTVKLNNREMELYGPKLNLNASCALSMGADKIKKILSPVIIGAFLNFNCPDDSQLKKIYYSSSINFRAAAAANMYWRAVKIKGEECFKWKIGKLSWLPRP